jgi:DNA mismatch repair ATPase MutS
MSISKTTKNQLGVSMLIVYKSQQRFMLFIMSSFIFLQASATISYKDIGDTYISSYGIVKKEITTNTDSQKKKNVNLKVHKLNEQEKRQLVFSTLSNSEKTDGQETHNTESLQQLLKDLAVLHGQAGSENIHLADILNHCSTVFGEVALANMLAQKINSAKIISDRQKLIKKLILDNHLYNQVEELLFNVQEHTDSFLSLWSEPTEAEKELIGKLYFGAPLTSFNTNPLMLESLVRLNNIGTAIGSCQIPLGLVMGGYIAQYIAHKYMNNNIPKPKIKEHIKNFVDMVNPYAYFDTIKQIDAKIDKMRNELIDEHIKKYNASLESATEYADKEAALHKKFVRIGTGINAVINTGMLAYQAYLTKKVINEATQTKNAINYLHSRLIGAGTFINAAKEITALGRNNQEIINGLALYEELTKLFATHKTEQLDQLIALLQTNTFKGKASFFSWSGRVLAANKLMEAHKQEFAQAMLALGELDACLAIAKLIKKFENKRVGYCFVEFVEDETPYLKLEDYWNPFVNPETVVTNSIEFGGQQPRAIIVTGSNTGGKSTNLKAIMISVLLARTFGIAPARSATMTPFAYMGTSMNVSDNTAKGDSLFQAEVKRAERLVNTIDALRDEFGILIIDELFTGTAAEKGAFAAKRVAEHLAKSQNAILILATHFPELTKLEQETNLFKNYKVDVYKDEQGNLIRPFKLEPGVSTSNIADDILHEHLSFLTA